MPPTTTDEATCAVGDHVPCCVDGECGAMCAGDQCCPNPGFSGSVTCPSASQEHFPSCTHAKVRDCTMAGGSRRLAAEVPLWMAWQAQSRAPIAISDEAEALPAWTDEGEARGSVLLAGVVGGAAAAAATICAVIAVSRSFSALQHDKEAGPRIEASPRMASRGSVAPRRVQSEALMVVGEGGSDSAPHAEASGRTRVGVGMGPRSWSDGGLPGVAIRGAMLPSLGPGGLCDSPDGSPLGIAIALGFVSPLSPGSPYGGLS